MTKSVLAGSTKNITITVTSAGTEADLTSPTCKIYDSTQTLLHTLTPSGNPTQMQNPSTGVYTLVLDTVTLDLDAGKYYLEISGTLDSLHRVHREALVVKFA